MRRCPRSRRLASASSSRSCSRATRSRCSRCAAAAAGDLSRANVTLDSRAAVTVVLAAPDYPRRSDYAGATIAGLEAAEAAGALVFHGGTAARDGRVITNGGRILSVTATADSVGAARTKAYEAVDLLSFDGAVYRRDIAAGVDG